MNLPETFPKQVNSAYVWFHLELLKNQKLKETTLNPNNKKWRFKYAWYDHKYVNHWKSCRWRDF